MITLDHCNTFAERRIEFPIREGYIATNISVAVHHGRIFGLVCCGDHWMDAGGFYRPLPPDFTGPLDPNRYSDQICYLVELGPNMDVLWSREVRVTTPPVPTGETFKGFRGFDSARLFVWRDALWSVMCAMGTGAKPGAELFLASIVGVDPEFTNTRRILANGVETHAEKNWMPEVRGDELRFHYRLGTIADIDGKLTDIGSRVICDHLNGGSQVIPAKHGLGSMCIVHGFAQIPDTFRREYWHQLARLDVRGHPIALSQPFHICNAPPEIVTGMAYHPNGKDVILSYGRGGAERDMPNQEFPFVATLSHHELVRTL